jgi:hypothetical protein
MEVVNGAEVLKALKPEQYATYAQQIAELKEANGFCDEDFIFASQINIPVNAVGTTTSKSKRVGALVLDPKNVNSWRNRNAWKDCVVDEKNGNGIYVQINNFHAVINGGDKMVGSLLLDLVQPFKNIDPANIVGFTSTQLKKKMGSGWVRLEDKMQEEFDAFISANKIDIDLLLANRLGNTMLRDSFFYRLQDKKHQDLLMSLIKSDDDRATLRDLFACVNSHNNDANSKSKEQIAIMLISKIERINIAAGNASGKNEKAVKIAEEVVNRAKALQKKFPLLSYIEERNMRWGFSADFAKVLSDYMNA